MINALSVFLGVTRLRAPAKAAEGTTKVKSYYYFLIGLAGIVCGLWLRAALPGHGILTRFSVLILWVKKRPPKEPLVLLTTGATTNAKSYAVYAARFERDIRFAPAKPAMADMNNHAAAGSGTAETVAVTLEPSRP